MPDAPENSPGLFHVAFKIGTRIEELRQCALLLEAAGLDVEAYDHEVNKSIYFKDPDRHRSNSTLIHRTSGSKDPMPSRRGSNSIFSVILVKTANRRRRLPHLSNWQSSQYAEFKYLTSASSSTLLPLRASSWRSTKAVHVDDFVWPTPIRFGDEVNTIPQPVRV